jgi:hypothetical protein
MYVAPSLAYQVTLTNTASSTADVTGFAVAFYDSTGDEAGSDQPNTQETFITSGQSLIWTEVSTGNVADQSTVGIGSDSNIPSDSASCQVVIWYSGYQG